MSGDPKASRGYRNRNPGNIEHLATNKWLGLETPPWDGRFCRFRSHQHGIRALALLLQSYQDRHGLRTVRGIVARWAPSSENDTRAYQDVVAARLAEGDKDMRELTRTVTDLVKAMAGLTARLSLAAGGVPGASPAIPATGAAAAGGIVGAAVGAKLASWLGLG